LEINPKWKQRLPFLTVGLLQARIAWSIRLRWLAIAGFYLATLIIKYSFGLPIPYNKVWFMLDTLVVINVIYFIILKVYKEFSTQQELLILLIHAFFDLVLLTAIVHLAGGLENPIYLFYVFHVVISSIVFPGSLPLIMATFVVLLFGSLIYLEYIGYLVHYSIFNIQIHNNDLAVFVTFAVFTITVYVSTYICTTFMVVYRNIKRQVDEQNIQLIEADKQKTQFYQYTSHELKSPIIAVKTTIDGIAKSYRNQLDEKALDLMGRASNRCMQMLDIIKELLIITQSRSYSNPAENEKIIINDIIKETAHSEKNTADASGIEIEMDLTDRNPVITAKKADIIKIIDNLVSNAIRYNKEKGKIYISTEINKENLLVKIKDTGIGIPENDLSNIFAEFYRTENARKKVHYGTGLGLSLIKQLVENYNGSIKVKSEIEVGTTFSVSFPLSKGEKND
jgi:signal transduction histidine kinase